MFRRADDDGLMTSEKKIQALLFHWGMESSGDHHAGIAEFAYGVESFHDDASGALDGADQSKAWLTQDVTVADPVQSFPFRRSWVFSKL